MTTKVSNAEMYVYDEQRKASESLGGVSLEIDAELLSSAINSTVLDAMRVLTSMFSASRIANIEDNVKTLRASGDPALHRIADAIVTELELDEE